MFTIHLEEVVYFLGTIILNRLESIALFSKNGDVIETSMCDIETTIAWKYFEKNRKFIDD